MRTRDKQRIFKQFMRGESAIKLANYIWTKGHRGNLMLLVEDIIRQAMREKLEV